MNEYIFATKVTTACPCNCAFCSNRKQAHKKRESNGTLAIDLFEEYCKAIVNVGGKYICLSGGEPTLLSNLEEYIKVAKKYDLVVRVNTNGWGVTNERLSSLLDAGLDQIVMSVYSLDKNKMEKIRNREGVFDRAMAALEAIKNAKSTRKFLFIIQTIIMKDNYKEIPDILRVAINVKADIFWPSYLEDAQNNNEANLDEEDILDFTENVLPKMKHCFEKSIENKSIASANIKNCDKLFKPDSLRNDFSMGIYHHGPYDCKLLNRYACLHVNGNLTPCTRYEYNPGEIYFKFTGTDSLKEFFAQCKKPVEEYCKYCPEGEHIGFDFSNNDIDEYSKL
ncbi:radical SAM protein [Anaerocolumna jejuensis]|uniref:radical SAM protein n=1 Tax=Anaerocolumna jejuensis TaxID=259063 RepID=UPI003F7BD262